MYASKGFNVPVRAPRTCTEAAWQCDNVPMCSSCLHAPPPVTSKVAHVPYAPLMPCMPNGRTPFDVETKTDASPVTIADRESEMAMRNILKKVGLV